MVKLNFYYCRCVVAINTKEINRFEVRPLKRFLCKALVRRDFVIKASVDTEGKNMRKKGISSTIQVTIRLVYKMF